MQIAPATVSEQSLQKYAVYLASNLSFASIGKYLNIVCIVHKELGMGNPLENNYTLNVVLKGIKRIKGDTS